MLPSRIFVSRVMSKGNHNQGSTRDEIWGEKDMRQRGRQKVRVFASLCVSYGGVFGLIVEVYCHAVMRSSCATLRLTDRVMFHPVSPFCTKSREGF